MFRFILQLLHIVLFCTHEHDLPYNRKKTPMNTQPPKSKTTFRQDLDAATYRNFCRYAKRRGLTLNQAVNECARAHMQEVTQLGAASPEQRPTA